MSKTIEKRIKSNIPYDIKMRVDGKYDYVGMHRFSEDEPTVDLSLGEEYDYDGLSIESQETPNSQPIINSTGTILPWRYEYNTSLTNNRFCLMPYDSNTNYSGIQSYEIDPDTGEKRIKKVPNLISTSKATVDGYILSNFDGTCRAPSSFTLYKAYPFEMHVKAKTGSSTSGYQCIMFGNGINLQIYNGKFRGGIYFNGSWSSSTAGSIGTNTVFYMRLIYHPTATERDGKTYDANYAYIEYSFDDVTWSTVKSCNLGTNWINSASGGTGTSTTISIALGSDLSTNEDKSIFYGTIDASGVYLINNNGTYTSWDGLKVLSESMYGCIYDYEDNGEPDTLNVFTKNKDNGFILTKRNSINNQRLLGTINIPEHDVYRYIGGSWETGEQTLLKDTDYNVLLVGGGGGGSAYNGGAGAYWHGIVTPKEDITITTKFGNGGFENIKNTVINSGDDGVSTSIFGNGLSIVCPGGQGSLSSTDDPTGDLSEYTYAPQINITNADYFELGASTNSKRTSSWYSSYGTGGSHALISKNSGYKGNAGYILFNRNVYNINVTTIPADADCTISIKSQTNDNTYTSNNKSAKFVYPSSIQVVGEKEGYQRTTKTYSSASGNINLTLQLLTGTWLGDSGYYMNNISSYSPCVGFCFYINPVKASQVEADSTIELFNDGTNHLYIKRTSSNGVECYLNSTRISYRNNYWETLFNSEYEDSYNIIFYLNKYMTSTTTAIKRYYTYFIDTSRNTFVSLSTITVPSYVEWGNSITINDSLIKAESGFSIKYPGFTSQTYSTVRINGRYYPNLLSYSQFEKRTITINPTPSDATVMMSTDGSTYTEVNTIQADELSYVYYKVEKEGYYTSSGKIYVMSDVTKNITLVEEGDIGPISNIIDGSNFEINDGIIRNGSVSYNVDNGYSYGYFEYTSEVDTTLSINASCSSESNYDYFGCYVGTTLYNATYSQVKAKTTDGNGSWLFNLSGLTTQETYTTTLTAGTHYYIQFYYTKDSIENDNDDRGYIYNCTLS